MSKLLLATKLMDYPWSFQLFYLLSNLELRRLECDLEYQRGVPGDIVFVRGPIVEMNAFPANVNPPFFWGFA